MAYTFQIGEKKMKLHTEYENVTQHVLYLTELILRVHLLHFVDLDTH